LRQNDIVIAMNGQPVDNGSDFRLRVSRTAPGTAIQLRVLREGKEMTIPITLGTLPGSADAAEPGPGEPSGTSSPLEGVSVDELNPEISQQLRLPVGVTGVVVTEVEPGSAAASAGLQRGDVIEQVNRKDISSIKEFEAALRGSKTALLLVRRGGGTAFIVVEPDR
jgi:serine protease Do